MRILRLTAGTPFREWCDECFTAGVVGFEIWAFGESGLTLFGTYRVCQRCEETSDAAW